MNSNQNQNEKADEILEQEIKDLNKLNNYNLGENNLNNELGGLISLQDKTILNMKKKK